MKEYKIIESFRSTQKTVDTLNELAADRWQVIAVTEYQVMLEREKQDDTEGITSDEKVLLHD